MPTYEYLCDACGHNYEIVQKISEDSLKTCPTCGKEALKRIINASAFHLKGSGWYKTDYASTTGSGSGASSSSSNGSGDSKATGSGSESGSGTTATKTENAGTSSNASSGTVSTSSSGDSSKVNS